MTNPIHFHACQLCGRPVPCTAPNVGGDDPMDATPSCEYDGSADCATCDPCLDDLDAIDQDRALAVDRLFAEVQ